MKKVLIVVGVLIALAIILVVGFLIYAKLNSGDIAAPDDSDLALVIKDIPKEENSYYDLLSASQKLYWPEDKKDTLDKISNGEEWDEALVADILAKNKETLNLFDKTSQLSQFQDPDFVNVIKNSYYDPNAPAGNFYSSLRNLAKLESIEANSFFRKKDFKGAISGAIENMRIGNILENSQDGSPISYLIGMSIKKIGIANFGGIIEEAKSSKFNLAPFSGDLENLKVDEKSVAKNILKTSYQYDKVNLDATTREIKAVSLAGIYQEVLFSSKISDDSSKSVFYDFLTSPDLLGKSSFYYKPNETKKLVADNYRRDIRNIESGCINIVSEQGNSKGYNFPVKSIFIKNSVGKMLADMTDILHPTIFKKLCEENAEIDNLIYSIK